MSALTGKTIFITGASRGIGREIALRCARDEANVVIAAKSDTPHAKLPGTIYSVAEEVQQAGGRALALKLDVRDEELVTSAMRTAAEYFGGIDALINNAGAIRLTNVENTPIKRFDLIHSINERAVLVCSRAALPYLKQSTNGHIINLSPPLNLDPKWLKPYIPYTVTKYGMTLLTLGMAEEFREYGIGVNSLWPRTTIATSAIEFEIDSELLKQSRKPAIMADATYQILCSLAENMTGRALLDEDVLREHGCTDFNHYNCEPARATLTNDLYVD